MVHATGDHGHNTVHMHGIVVSIHARYSCISTHGNYKVTFYARLRCNLGTIYAHFRHDLGMIYGLRHGSVKVFLEHSSPLDSGVKVNKCIKSFNKDQIHAF